MTSTSSEGGQLAAIARADHGSFELVLSPVIMGLFGWLLDARAFGTTPWLTVTLSVLGVAGAAVKQFYRYRDRMDRLAEDAPWSAGTTRSTGP